MCKAKRWPSLSEETGPSRIFGPNQGKSWWGVVTTIGPVEQGFIVTSVNITHGYLEQVARACFNLGDQQLAVLSLFNERLHRPGVAPELFTGRLVPPAL